MKKVLMASPSKALLSRNTSLLKDKGFLFYTASSGAQALELHGEHQFSLILTDLELDGMNGCELCSEVNKNGAPVPVIVICHDTEQHVQQVKQSEAAAILLRPINPTHLLITIGSFIDMQLARSKRVEFNSLVLVKKPDMELLCDSRDISATGIRIATEQQLDVGVRLSCQFTLPDICQIQTEAEVIRYNATTDDQNRHVYGVRFIDMPPANRNAISKYVASNNHLGIKQKPHRPLERSFNYQAGAS